MTEFWPSSFEKTEASLKDEIKKNELDETIETSDINSVGLISEKESEPRSEMKPTTKIKPSLERSKTIEVSQILTAFIYGRLQNCKSEKKCTIQA